MLKWWDDNFGKNTVTRRGLAKEGMEKTPPFSLSACFIISESWKNDLLFCKIYLNRGGVFIVSIYNSVQFTGVTKCSYLSTKIE